MNIPLWISNSIVLDARRAVWFPRERTLAVANLRLGWTPAEESPARDETVAQLLALAADYHPERVVLLGDLFHPQAFAPGTAERFRALTQTLQEQSGVVLVGDPQDPALAGWLGEAGWEAGVVPSWQCGKHHLSHLDLSSGEETPLPTFPEEGEKGARHLLASEHPGITLGEAAPVCCPCFLLAEGLLLLPAFSPWVEPLDFRRSRWHLPGLEAVPWSQAIAIAAGKLVPVELPRPFPPGR